MATETVTAIGTPNIALVKYWGRRNAAINLPTNSSISITLDESLHTKTSVLFSDRLKEDTMYINGERLSFADTKNEKTIFTAKVLQYMRELAGTSSHALVVSQNSFPTASGLASSASGAATLCFAVSKALGLDLTQQDLSVIARMISGSACRSVAGGFVLWKKGEREDGSDSYAEPIADQNYWPEVIDVITMVSGDKKKISSSDGHRLTPETSDLYKARPESADDRVAKLSAAILKKDFQTLAKITMRDSNSLHATMLDTYPPIVYLNDISRAIMYAVQELNEREGSLVAAYTFDAGPNAQIITLEKHRAKVIDAVKEIVGEKNVMVARQGGGPRLLGDADSLIDESALAPV
ncbi:MAG: diphosphomevalonate decarboxylase [Candidatus Micrarchaeales archaeon]